MTYPLTKKVCQLDEQGIYAGQTDADLSPEEADNGVYLMPAGCVDIDPPEDKKGFVAKWTGEAWEYIENHIGETVYSTTKESLVISEFGSIPDGYTAVKPESEYRERQAAAEAYKSANYEGDCSRYITDFALRAGLDNKAATNLILMQAAGLEKLLVELANQRMRKYELKAPNLKLEQMQSIYDDIIKQMDHLMEAYNNG